MTKTAALGLASHAKGMAGQHPSADVRNGPSGDFAIEGRARRGWSNIRSQMAIPRKVSAAVALPTAAFGRARQSPWRPWPGLHARCVVRALVR